MKSILKMLSFVSSIVFCVTIITGCSGAAAPANTGISQDVAPKETLSIVSTTFPIYDWVQNILGETAENTKTVMLENTGVDLHSYQPTAQDIVEISNCDVFIYVGGESDSWVDATLKTANNPDCTVINLLDILGSGTKMEEVVEGMQEEAHDHDSESEEEAHDHDHESEEEAHDHDHESEEKAHDHDHESEEKAHDHDHESEEDEHVWLSLKNAEIFVQAISESLSSKNPADALIYQQNAGEYIQKLQTLDQEYEAMVKQAEYDTVLFGDRFPFRYLVDDYGLHYYAAFVGCSAETEASFQTIQFLSEKLEQLNLPAVLTIEGSDGKIAQTVINNTAQKNQAILQLNSMQSVTQKQVENGTEYLTIMQDNLAVLQQALNKGNE